MKTKTTTHRCEGCGYSASKWFGRCPDCGSWSTSELLDDSASAVQVTTLGASRADLPDRLVTSVDEFDRVVGGGLVPGSVVLLAGEPGIGKSTLVLQIVDALLAHDAKCLLATGEESLDQVALRGDRLGLRTGPMKAVATPSIDVVERACAAEAPDVLIIDSIQTMEDPALAQGPGSPTQVRECAARLVRLAKTSATTIVVVGHVTKDGGVAGPKTLEHVVDAVLSLEGERTGTLRLLRAAKNRFGSCEETGVFVMSESGLEEVADPSELLVGERRTGISGSVVFPALHGSRPVLIEIQALVVDSKLGRRVAIGIEPRRLSLVLGVLSKRMGMDFMDKDVFVAAAGGAAANEPAADLAIALALASAITNVPFPAEGIAVGELGLAGEVRTAPGLVRRLGEAGRLGFKTAFVPPRAPASRAPRSIAVDDVVVAIDNALHARVSTTPSQ